MDEATLQNIARQLRQPHGEFASQVGEKMNEGNHYINHYTITALQAQPGDHLLEIGMGNGFFVQDILSAYPSVRYAGCDFSEAMVEEAGRRNAAFIENGQAQFYLAGAEQLPFAAETFDKVFTVNTIYFWDDPALVLAEIRRVLKPSGQLFISIRPKALMQYYPFVKYGFRMFSSQDLSELLVRNNFTVIEILEKQEPPQEMNGQSLAVETLMVSAVK